MKNTVLNGTVVVVLDQAIKLSAMNALRRANSQVTVAPDAVTALGLCRTHQADVVIDRLGATGVKGCRRCQEITKYTTEGGAAVVLAADGASGNDFRACLRGCAARVFSRSSADAFVLFQIAHAIEQRQAERAAHEVPPARTCPRLSRAERAQEASPEPDGSRWAFKASLLDIPSEGASPVERLASQASDAWFWLKLRAKSYLAAK